MNNPQSSPASSWMAFLFGVVLTLLLIASAEIFAGLFYKEPSALDTHYADGYFYYDAAGVSRPSPGGRYASSETSRLTGQTLYDVIYSVDAHSRRMTPAGNPQIRSKHAIFFGCSFTYGEGLADSETYPAQFALHAREYQPYNYAFHGHSPAEMLAKLESGTLKEEVKETQGYLIYLFIDAHILRVIGSMSIASSWGKFHPYYFLNKEGEPERKGNFTTGRPVLNRVYSVLGKSKLLKLLKVEFPPRITAKHIDLTAKVIEKAAALYTQEYPQGKFIAVIYPGSRYGGKIAEHLKAAGISVLDYTNLFNAADPRYILSPEDFHPSALADAELGGRLARDLNLN